MSMPRPYLLALLLAVSLAMAIVHNLAFMYFWYWRFWWLDLLMHTSGGFFIAGAIYLSEIPIKTYAVIGIAFLVSVLWEVFELVAGVSYSSTYTLDTGLDLICGVFGTLVMCAMMLRWHKKSALLLPVEPAV